MFNRIGIAVFLIFICCSFSQVTDTLKGTWEYAGDIFHGKKEGAPDGYKLQRKYKDGKFDAYILEKGEKPFIYQSGNYQLKADSCFETETFSAQPSKLTGVTINYHYIIRQDTLVLQGTLPTGMTVEEYWKRLK